MTKDKRYYKKTIPSWLVPSSCMRCENLHVGASGARCGVLIDFRKDCFVQKFAEKHALMSLEEIYRRDFDLDVFRKFIRRQFFSVDTKDPLSDRLPFSCSMEQPHNERGEYVSLSLSLDRTADGITITNRFRFGTKYTGAMGATGMIYQYQSGRHRCVFNGWATPGGDLYNNGEIPPDTLLATGWVDLHRKRFEICLTDENNRLIWHTPVHLEMFDEKSDAGGVLPMRE